MKKIQVLLVVIGVLIALASSLTYANGQNMSTMNNYVDQYGRYHDQPVTEADPVPSNNGWIYTAYAKKAGLPVDEYKLKMAADMCYQGYGIWWRSPGKELPPLSRDEVLGMVELGVIPLSEITDDWNFSPYVVPKFSLIKLIKQLWQLRPTYEYVPGLSQSFKSSHRLVWKHRNYFWQNNLDQIYRFAFSVPLVDRHYILSKQGKFNIFYWAISKIDSMIGGESGIRYLKYGKSKKAMKEEFPADHPIQGV